MSGSARLLINTGSYVQRVEEICSLLKEHLEDVSSLHIFYSHRQKIRSKNGLPMVDPENLALADGLYSRLVVYRAWCYVFRECLLERNQMCTDVLLVWLDDFHKYNPPKGLCGIIEQARLFILLRTAYLTKIIGKTKKHMLISIASRHDLNAMLPFMQSNVDTEDYQDIISSVFDVDDDESLYSLDDDEDNPQSRSWLTSSFNKNDDFGAMASDPIDSINEDGSTEDDGKNPDEKLYRVMATKENILLLYKYAHDEEVTPFGPFDKRVFACCFEQLHSRSSAYIDLIAYLERLEICSDSTLDFEQRYIECSELYLRVQKRFPPSQSVAKQLLSAMLRQCKLASEMGYHGRMLHTITRSVEEITRLEILKADDQAEWSADSIGKITQDHALNSALAARKLYSKKPKSDVYSPESFENAPSYSLVAEVENVWLQIDPQVDRVMVKNENESEEEITSVKPGCVRLFKDEITWVIKHESNSLNLNRKRRTSKQTSSSLPSLETITNIQKHIAAEALATKLPSYNAIERKKGQAMERLLQTLNGDFSQLIDSQQIGTFESKVSFNQPHAIKQIAYPGLNDMDIESSLITVPISAIKRQEAEGLTQALSDFTGMDPFVQESHIESLLKENLEQERIRILEEKLLTEQSPWISHTANLADILSDLTNEDAPVNLDTLERLYHSCCVNKQVIIETVKILKRLWIEKHSENGRMRVISVLVRILDGGIVQSDLKIIDSILSWLHELEITLDPHKSSRSLKMILSLCATAERLQAQTLTPLGNKDKSTIFMMKDEYNTFLRLYS